MKHELPPFRMTVEGGRLAPADAFTAERLDSYRNGSAILMQPVTDPMSKRRKQYFAILSLVIRDCPSPWRRVTDASNALKEALGVVEHGHTVAGVPTRYLRSLNDLSEPEFEVFFDDAMMMLHRVTGVDPLTLRKEAADTGDDPEQEPPASAPHSPAGADSGGQRPQAAAVDPSKVEAVDKYLQYAGDETLTADRRLDGLLSVNLAWLDRLPDEPAFLSACRDTAEKLIKGEVTKKAAKSYLLALAAKEGKGNTDGE
ncbi:hypothetical protein GR217_34190 [Rhizobium leguminosarum]|uniref:Uncharacterized protein n=1 Tax=Rhizobium ruizarguesonis TaxID=2081791 RepID=A0AAE4YWT7_9HYPH|nr:hypothetical protein [Rhizobium ruizarguesonis]NEI52670.1 hypothetical protein [Rhizobium ruizarguesonis]